MTKIALDTAEVQPKATTVAVKLPPASTTMDCVVAPLLQRLPARLLEVNVTLSPSQKVVGPFAEIVGETGIGFTVTTVGKETAEVHPSSTT